jgi:hypothetical protein
MSKADRDTHYHSITRGPRIWDIIRRAERKQRQWSVQQFARRRRRRYRIDSAPEARELANGRTHA